MPHSITAQDHMSVHLWLRCRTMLVTALVRQIHGVGDMEGITLFWFRLLEYNGQMSLFRHNSYSKIKNINMNAGVVLSLSNDLY